MERMERMDDDGTAFGRFHQEGSGDMYVDPVDIRLEEGMGIKRQLLLSVG
jgi:hypothetical protein